MPSSSIRVLSYDWNDGSPVISRSKASRSIIDGDGTATHCVYQNGVTYWIFSGFDFINAASHGFYKAANYVMLIYCGARNNGGDGFNTGNYATVFWCEADGNATLGLNSHGWQRVWGCVFANNGSTGLDCSYRSAIGMCLAHGNGGSGMQTSTMSIIYGNVCHGNDESGIYTTNKGAVIVGNRATDNGHYGIRSSVGDGADIEQYNYASGNAAGDFYATPLIGGDTQLTGDSHGLRDPANDDFRLLLGAPGFRQPILMPDGVNVIYPNIGLPNVPILRRES
jgi:hypothetical protein